MTTTRTTAWRTPVVLRLLDAADAGDDSVLGPLSDALEESGFAGTLFAVNKGAKAEAIEVLFALRIKGMMPSLLPFSLPALRNGWTEQ